MKVFQSRLQSQSSFKRSSEPKIKKSLEFNSKKKPKTGLRKNTWIRQQGLRSTKNNIHDD